MARSRPLPLSLVSVAAIITALGASAPPAAAYVRKVTASGAPYRWSGAAAAFDVHLATVPGLTPDGIAQAVTAAVQSWTTVPCTSARIDLTFAQGPGLPTANDGINVIGARSDGWCVAGDATPSGEAGCNDPSSVAVTSVFADAKTGRILGADTQLNTLTVSWAVLDPAGAPAEMQDLQSVLTHELGHVLGLEHPCWAGVGDRANDDHDQPIPDCYNAPEAVRQDTMFPSFEPGILSRRALSAEDARAVCEIYPLTLDEREGSSPAGCALGGPAPASGGARELVVVLVLGVAGIGVMRRRRNLRRDHMP